MPILNVQLSGTPSQTRTKAVATKLTHLTTDILKKKRELTAVVVSDILPEQWFIGGGTLASSKRRSFSLNIKVTEGTNTKNEKSKYVAAVFAAMQDILGELAPASYVVIQEVCADSWGFGGSTQEHRYIHGKII